MAVEVNPEQMNSIIRNTPPGPRRDALLAAMQSAPGNSAPSAPSTAAAPNGADAAVQMAQAKAQEAQAKADEQRVRADARQRELEIRQELSRARAAEARAREDRRAEREAQQAEKRMATAAAQRQTARLRGMEKTGALLPAHPALHSTSILPTDKDVRFLDAALVAAAGAGSALWTASRQTTMAQVGWATFFDVLGVLAAVQGSAELQYFGFGMLGANSGYLALRLIHPDLHPPQPAQQSNFVGMITAP